MDIVKALKAFFELLTAIVNGGFLRLSTQVHYIYSRLDEIVYNLQLGINRAVILRIHNGGGNLSSSRPTYSSVVYEVHRSPLTSIRNQCQNIPADRYFMSLLQELKLNTSVILDIPNMPDSWLKSFYSVQGVRKVKMFLIKEDRGGFLGLQTKGLQILSVSTALDDVPLTSDADNVELTKLVSDIKRKL